MKYNNISRSSLTLENLLRRKRRKLAEWLNDVGIVTWPALEERCTRMGVVPPAKATFDAAVSGQNVSAPAEGVVVIAPAPETLPFGISPDVVSVDPPVDPSPEIDEGKRKRGFRAAKTTTNS